MLSYGFVALTFLLIGSAQGTWPCQNRAERPQLQGGRQGAKKIYYFAIPSPPLFDFNATEYSPTNALGFGIMKVSLSIINAKRIVEVGVAWGAQTAYHLKHGADFIEEYHVVDPFLAGYDANDPMSKLIAESAPDASYEDISLAWYQGMSMDLGNDGMYLQDEPMPPAGCRLRMHRYKSVEGAKLFGDLSVDAVFIDGLHTYEGVLEDIEAWMSKIVVGGSLIFNDFQDPHFGVNKAVWEMADRHNIKITMIDPTNAVFGGKESCIKGPPTAVRISNRERKRQALKGKELLNKKAR
mmetsp:Transcript_28369/g.43962  ORF Transcript_28369/g.43962 Transcript_28369/m.43962 type:complete len:296 (-) Transcript_28369:15-902(-)